MNSQDITRAIIDTTVEHTMKEMDADPHRSVRKLCDLGKQFSKGRFQNEIFTLMQDLLRNDNSPYYKAIDTLLKNNDHKTLRHIGINIGYNSFTYGAKILRAKEKETGYNIPWTVSLRINDQISRGAGPSLLAYIAEKGMEKGIFTYLLYSEDNLEQFDQYLNLIHRFRDCAFVWFLPDLPLTDEQCKLISSCSNLMLSFPAESEHLPANAAAMQHYKSLYSIHYLYDEDDVHLWEKDPDFFHFSMYGSVFLFLLADEDCPPSMRSTIAKAVYQYRLTPQYPVFPLEIFEDICRIDRIISTEPSYLEVFPDRSVRTIDGSIYQRSNFSSLDDFCAAVLPKVGYEEKREP
ncbi:MAG: hypothetical protein ACI4EG_09275 [Fusicatenibacter sp.]|nr:hypothetical protein [Fusicatenibacter sp.]